jgi:hypothetical protein
MATITRKLIFQLKITLKHVRPAIWRRVQVAADVKLDRLHMVLQDAFGWTNSHLHHFEIGRVRYGMVGPDEFDDQLQDCGGPYGYQNLLEAIADPKHEEHVALTEWLGGPFDSERFDVAEADRLVRSARSRQLAWLSR